MKKGKYLNAGQQPSYGTYVLILVALILVAVMVLAAWAMWLKPDKEQDLYEYETPTTTAPTEPEPTEPSTEPEPEPPLVEQEPVSLQQAREILAEMSQEEKVYQLFVVTPEQLVATEFAGTVTQSGATSQKCIQQYPVGGIVYFSKNLENREQTIKMISDLQSYSKLGLFISVDEEGGSVVRIADNAAMGTTWLPKMLEVGGTGDINEAYHVGKTLSSELAQLGFNLDFAPVADVYSNPNNTVIGSRAFSRDPQVAADMVGACVEGFQESSTLCTLKHFPGHGDTGTDSHYGAAQSNKTLDELRACEFLPFQAGIAAGADCVMIGHVTLPNVTEEDVPATLSYEIVTGLLREELGFKGLVITDAMNMGAISNHYTSGEAAVKALKAGVDMILMPTDFSAAVKGVNAALEDGTLTQEALDEKILRILQVKIEAGIIVVE